LHNLPKIVKRKRLIFVLPSAHAGGAERVLLNLLGSLDRRRFDLHLIIIDPSGPYLKLIPADVSQYGLGYKRVGRAIVSLAVVLRKLRPDVVLSTIVHLNLAILLIKPLLHKKTKLYIRESNTLSMSLATGAKATLFRLLYQILYPGADGIICPGEAIKKDLNNNFRIGAHRMVTIPNPVHLDKIRSKINPSYDPLQPGGIRLLAAGSLTRQKGFDLLIQAMAGLVKIRPGIHLTILGDGPEKNNLLNRIHSFNLLDSITLAGFQQNPYPYFYHADLFVLSSRWEGLPNVVLESLACGTPVVAFDCPGGVSEIFDDPSQGTLVPVGNIDALVTAIDHWLENKKATSKDSLLPARFEVKSVTQKYEQILSGY